MFHSSLTRNEWLKRLTFNVVYLDRKDDREYLHEHPKCPGLDQRVQSNKDRSNKLALRRAQLAAISQQAKDDRKPPPPEQLIGALQDRVHSEDGESHTVRAAKVGNDAQ